MKNFKIKAHSYRQDIILLEFDTRFSMSSALLRMQEFHESPNLNFQGRHFTLDAYMDWYASTHGGKFTYFDDWDGFNIQGDVLLSWHSLFSIDLRANERAVLDAVYQHAAGMEKFYVIANHAGISDDISLLEHEVSHALFYLDKDYSLVSSAKLHSENFPEEHRKALFDYLVTTGYAPSVYNDEAVAYLATSDQSWYDEVGIPYSVGQQHRDLFRSAMSRAATGGVTVQPAKVSNGSIQDKSLETALGMLWETESTWDPSLGTAEALGLPPYAGWPAVVDRCRQVILERLASKPKVKRSCTDPRTPGPCELGSRPECADCSDRPVREGMADA